MIFPSTSFLILKAGLSSSLIKLFKNPKTNMANKKDKCKTKQKNFKSKNKIRLILDFIFLSVKIPIILKYLEYTQYCHVLRNDAKKNPTKTVKKIMKKMGGG